MDKRKKRPKKKMGLSSAAEGDEGVGSRPK